MRIACHVSNRVFHTWPAEYWYEFIEKATKAGHDIYVFSDESGVLLDVKNPHVYSLIGLTDDEERQGMEVCDVFVGPKLRYYHMADEFGLKMVGLLGATLDGCGVKSTHPCAGCLDKLENQVDCYFADELCYTEITPNDVLAAL